MRTPAINKLKTYLDRLIRNIERKAVQMEGSLKKLGLRQIRSETNNQKIDKNYYRGMLRR